MDLLRLFKGITPPISSIKELLICENLSTRDALYPVIRVEINDFLSSKGYSPWVGMPGWTTRMPDPTMIDPKREIINRNYNFMQWFEPLVKNTQRNTEYIRVRKEALCGAPMFSRDSLTKVRIYEHVCKITSWSYYIDNKDLLPHTLAARLQTNDPWGKVRSTPRYSIETNFEGVSEGEVVTEELSPYDSTLSNLGLQKPRGRTPRMVSLYLNLPLMKKVQSYKIAETFPLPNGSSICFSNDPKKIEAYVNEIPEYLFWLSFDRKSSEFNTHPESIRQTARFVGNAPLEEFILNWNWIVRGILFKNCYMGNPSGIATVLLTNNIETLAVLNFLGIIDERGLINSRVIILGDAACVGFKSFEDLTNLANKLKLIDTISVEPVPKIGQKTIRYIKESNSFRVFQSPASTLMSFWAPEYDAGGKSRPFYGIGRKQRWADFYGDSVLRDEFAAFEDYLINKYSLVIIEKTPPVPTAYDVYSYYWLIDAGREEEAKQLEPYIFNLYRTDKLTLV